MVNFPDTSNESEFINAIRGLFRAKVPESDAWAKPNFFSVVSSIVGGLMWSAINEVRNGIDLRLNPRTVSGEYLDLQAAAPPTFLTRRGPTQAKGNIRVNIPGLTVVPTGYQFQNSQGIVYEATAASSLVNGEGVVPVCASSSGSSTNSCLDQPMEIVSGDEGEAFSNEIVGGFDLECDDDFRKRWFASRSKSYFTGSPCALQRQIAAFDGVTKSWAVKMGGVPKLLFLMEDKYSNGEAQQEDIDAIVEYLKDECMVNMFFCPIIETVVSKKISPEICWTNHPTDICEVQQALQSWLRQNCVLGGSVLSSSIEAFLNMRFPQYGAKIKCCAEFTAECNEIINCAELIGEC